MFSLSGLDGSVAINGRTVTVKNESATKVLTAESIRGAAVWTGVLTGQFSIHYVAAPHTAQGKESGAGARVGAGAGAATRVTASVEYVSVQFKAADKGFWDAMATTIMATARAAASSTAAPSAAPAAAKQPADASPSPSPSPSSEATPPPGFDNWLNRTLGLEQDAKVG